jgi:hypothetical protein
VFDIGRCLFVYLRDHRHGQEDLSDGPIFGTRQNKEFSSARLACLGAPAVGPAERLMRSRFIKGANWAKKADLPYPSQNALRTRPRLWGKSTKWQPLDLTMQPHNYIIISGRA